MAGHKTTPGSKCQNCGEPLAGPYCSGCGQHDVDYHRSFGPVVEDALEGFLHFDGKFAKSARYIFTRPGFLTNEFIAGRRVRYAHPLRFYIFASFLFFAFTTLTNHKETPAEAAANKAEIAKAAKETSDELKAEGIKAPTAKTPSAGAASATKPLSPSGTSRIKAIQGVLNNAGNLDRAAFSRELAHLLPEMLFFCLPILALMLEVAFLRSGRFYVEHLIFALHIQAFVFLAMIVSSVVSYLTHFISDGVEQFAGAIVFFGSVWLAYRAFKNVYGRNSSAVSLKFVAVGLAYGAFLLAALLALVCISAYLVSHEA